jgi:hypothetical protein
MTTGHPASVVPAQRSWRSADEFARLIACLAAVARAPRWARGRPLAADGRVRATMHDLICNFIEFDRSFSETLK